MTQDYIPASLIAAWAKVSRQTIHTWATRDHWRTKGTSNKTTYHTQDVQTTLQHRHNNPT